MKRLKEKGADRQISDYYLAAPVKSQNLLVMGEGA